MPHVAMVPFTGFRVREEEMLALGMALPGLKQRAVAIAQLPALGLLTLAGLTPPYWTCSYHEAPHANEALTDEILRERPTLVALSALTASIEEAYCFSAFLRRRGMRVVLGGLHATSCSEEAREHCDAVVIGEGDPVWREFPGLASQADFAFAGIGQGVGQRLAARDIAKIFGGGEVGFKFVDSASDFVRGRGGTLDVGRTGRKAGGSQAKEAAASEGGVFGEEIGDRHGGTFVERRVGGILSDWASWEVAQ